MGGWAGGKEEAKIVISHSLGEPKIYQSVKIDLVDEVQHFSIFSLRPFNMMQRSIFSDPPPFENTLYAKKYGFILHFRNIFGLHKK